MDSLVNKYNLKKQKQAPLALMGIAQNSTDEREIYKSTVHNSAGQLNDLALRVVIAVVRRDVPEQIDAQLLLWAPRLQRVCNVGYDAGVIVS